MDRLHIGFMSSHGGSNMQAIIDACREGRLKAKPCVVISNNSRSKALERARSVGIPAHHVSGITHLSPALLDSAVLQVLEQYAVNLVILAGYMKLLGPCTVSRYRGRILNIHPALLPKFGGRGMYGKIVHKAVLDAGESVTGATVHIVDEKYDHGSMVAQRKIRILDGDTVDTLAERVLRQEHELYVETILRIESGDIKLSQTL